MTTLLVIVWAGACTLLLLHWSVRVERTRHSQFELKRRNDKESIRRESLINDVIAFREVVAAVEIIIMAAIAIVLWQAWGVVIMFGAVIVVRALSRLRVTHHLAHMLYDPWEQKILGALESFPLASVLLGSDTRIPHDQKLESVEQLLHLVETSGTVLSEDQERIIKHGISWHTTQVSTVMTKAKDIMSIKHSELLGPLVLDDLHRSGHNRFPVVRGTIDNVIGTLDLSRLLDVSTGKRSETAEKAMSPQVLRIEADETLPAALALLQKSHLHMLIVVDSDGKTQGLCTLADITGSLLGKNRGEVV